MNVTTLIAIRKALGYSQGELASLVGVDGGTWSRWERGRQNIQSPEMLALALVGVAAIHVAHTPPAEPTTRRAVMADPLATYATTMALAGYVVAPKRPEVAHAPETD